MSFKLSRLFYLVISYIIGSFFLILGIFGLILPWSNYLQNALNQFVLGNPLILSLFGLSFALIGISIVVYSVLHTRHHYIEIQVGRHAITLDETVVRQYLESYWQQHFPLAQIPFDLVFKSHSLQIIVDFPALPLSEQKTFVEKLKQDFNELFEKNLGYPHDVHLFAHFETNTSLPTDS